MFSLQFAVAFLFLLEVYFDWVFQHDLLLLFRSLTLTLSKQKRCMVEPAQGQYLHVVCAECLGRTG